jgi:4'-phosphopantetheinyl transferase
MAAEPARVWVIDLDSRDSGVGAPRGVEWLDARERSRAAALRDPAVSRRYVAAHVALRILMAGEVAAAPEDLHFRHESCSACGRDHGRPYLPGGPEFSLSRSGRWAAIALSAEERIGVDLEERQPAARLEPLRATLLAPGELSDDLLRTWVRKEAFVKASGEGLNRPLTTVTADSSVIDLDLGDDLVGAVAGVAEFTLETQASSRVRQPLPACPLPERAA